MNVDLNQALVEVTPTTFFNLDDADGTALVCVSGALWITRDNCLKDTVLMPGQAYEIEGAQPVIVTAFEPSTLRALNLAKLDIRVVHSGSSSTKLTRWYDKLVAVILQQVHAR